MFVRHRGERVGGQRPTDLELWSTSQGTTTFLIDVQEMEPCRVAGVVLRWRLDPDRDRVTVTISDGTGCLDAVWPIKGWRPRSVPAPGSGLVLEGVPVTDDLQALIMVEPQIREASFPAVA